MNDADLLVIEENNLGELEASGLTYKQNPENPPENPEFWDKCDHLGVGCCETRVCLFVRSTGATMCILYGNQREKTTIVF